MPPLRMQLSRPAVPEVKKESLLVSHQVLRFGQLPLWQSEPSLLEKIS
jgi:hypothetical protein